MEKIQILKKEIELMSKYHQIEILRLCKEDNEVLINENNNGSFINLTDQKDKFINKLEVYVNYVIEQKKQLEIIEKEKSRIENNYFKDSINTSKELFNNKQIKDNYKEVYNEF
tara:strand:+ start:290 stop:628 length:339 start_codon:yes stop_codon:yes gene_type:complete